jgi:MFS family permease
MSDKSVNAQDLLFKNRNFRLLWLGQIVSNFGDSLTSLSLLLLVNRLSDGGTGAVATMAIMIALPQITFGLLAGVYVDRHDRKRIMIASDLLRGALVLAFIPAALSGRLWALYTIAFVQASVGTFFTPARSALLPNIVDKEGLMAANSISQTSRIVFNLLGTGAAGVLAGMFDTFTPAFAADGATFFISALLLSRMQTPSRAPQDAARSAKAVLSQLWGGFGIIFNTRALLGIMVGAGVAMLALGAVNVLLVPLMINDLQVSEKWFAALEGAQVSSMVLSGALVAVLAARLKPTRIVSSALMLLGVLVGLMSAIANVWHLILLLFAAGWVMTPLQVSIATLIQTTVSDEVRGRISAANNTVISTTNVISMALAGALADVVGVRNVFIVGGALCVLAGWIAALIFRGVQGQPQAEAALQPAPSPARAD